MLSGRLFPYHPKPLPDELLSSWLARIAHGHGQKAHGFCQAVWPGMQIWNRDIDGFQQPELIAGLAEMTGTPLDTAYPTTLASYEGELVQAYFATGRAKWVLRLGIFHRLRRHGGLQFCPSCLASGPVPFYRRRWRLAWSCCCTTHELVLHDCCPACGEPVVPFRAEEMGRCFKCDFDLKEASPISASKAAITLQKEAETIASQGWGTWHGVRFQRAFLFFDLLHQVLKVLSSGPRAAKFRLAIAEHWGGDPRAPRFRSTPREIEALDVSDRHRMMDLAERVLDSWPNRFVKAAAEAGLWHSWAMKDLKDPPYEYERVVRGYLYKPTYVCSLEEIEAARRYLENRGQRISARAIKELLGDSKLLRSRSFSTHE